MKLPSSTEVYLAMIPRRSSLVSCFGSGREPISSSTILIVLSSIVATWCAKRARIVLMWIPRLPLRRLGGLDCYLVVPRDFLHHKCKKNASCRPVHENSLSSWYPLI